MCRSLQGVWGGSKRLLCNGRSHTKHRKQSLIHYFSTQGKSDTQKARAKQNLAKWGFDF